MWSEAVQVLIFPEVLRQCVFIHYLVWHILKEGWCDPWLKEQPTAEVDTADFVAVEVELELALALVQRVRRGKTGQGSEAQEKVLSKHGGEIGVMMLKRKQMVETIKQRGVVPCAELGHCNERKR